MKMCVCRYYLDEADHIRRYFWCKCTVAASICFRVVECCQNATESLREVNGWQIGSLKWLVLMIQSLMLIVKTDYQKTLRNRLDTVDTDP